MTSANLQGVGGVVASPHEQHAAGSGDAGDGVGHRHEWGMQGRGHAPHSMVA